VQKLTLNGNRSGMRGDEQTSLKLTAEGLTQLQGWDKLETLQILQSTLEKGALESIRGNSKLKNLILNFCQFAPGDLAVLPSLTSLEKLDLNGPSFRAEDLDFVAQATALKELSFTKPVSLNELRKLKGLKKLERLDIPCAQYPFAELWNLLTEDFGRSPEEAVRLIFKTLVDMQGNVIELDLGRFSMRRPEATLSQADVDLTAAIIQHLPQLRKLELPPGISNDALQYLVHTPKLEWLEIDSPKVTDAGLVHLRKLQHLVRVNSTDAPFTEQGVRELTKLPSIKNLALWGTKISEKDAAKLQKEFPDIGLSLR
jgi:hypothetical protein